MYAGRRLFFEIGLGFLIRFTGVEPKPLQGLGKPLGHDARSIGGEGGKLARYPFHEEGVGLLVEAVPKGGHGTREETTALAVEVIDVQVYRPDLGWVDLLQL